MAFRLAELFVEFSTKGTEAIHGAVTKAGLALKAFTVAGFATSAESERMTFLFGELSREVSSLFLPVFETVQQVVGDVTLWLRNLSGEQQRLLGFFGAIVAGTSAVSIAFGLLGIKVNLATAGLAAIVGSLVMFFAQNDKMKDAFGPLLEQMERIVNIVGPPLMEFFEKLAEHIVNVLVPVFEWLAEKLKALADWMGGSIDAGAKFGKEQHRSLSARGGGMESVTASYQRLQQSALKVDIPERHLAVAERQLKEAEKANEQLARIGPAVV